MGRKKKKPQKPWCWYCNREFEDEKILIQHQKAKHFKCHICNKKLFTGPGLAIHCMQVHKEAIDKIPGALPGRDNVSIEVYGMEGIPPESVRGQVEDETDGAPPNKIPRPSTGPSIPLPGMMPPTAPAPFGQFVRAPMPFGMPQSIALPPRPPVPPHQMAAMMAAAAAAAAGVSGFPPRIAPPLPPSSSSAQLPPLPPGGPPLPPANSIPMPPQTAFAAYQDKEGGNNINKDASKELPTASSTALMSKMGAKTRIVCPDELTSLEELMASRIVPQYTRGLLPFVR